MITVADPCAWGRRPIIRWTNLLLADAVVIKSGFADPSVELRHAGAILGIIIEAASPITVEDPAIIMGKRVLVIEMAHWHGRIGYGAGVVAAEKFGADELVDPREFAVGSIAEVYKKYPNTGALLPAMGYGAKQVRELEATIAAADCDAVVIGTPIDLRRVLKIGKPSVRVTYELQEIGRPHLTDVLERFLK
jgi:predicted GTPase